MLNQPQPEKPKFNPQARALVEGSGWPYLQEKLTALSGLFLSQMVQLSQKTDTIAISKPANEYALVRQLLADIFRDAGYEYAFDVSLRIKAHDKSSILS